MKLLSLAIALVLLIGNASANPKVEQARTSVAWVVFGCNAGDEGQKYPEGFCQGFIQGVYSGIHDWCVPASVTHEQLHDLIVTELRILNQADEADGSASDAIEEIISRRWPCE